MSYYPIDYIRKAVQWYAAINKDYNDIDSLVDARHRLACHLFNMAGELAEVAKERNRTEFIRKSSHARSIAKIVAGETKVSMALAEKMAENETEGLRSQESATDAEWTAMKILYDAASNVLDTMAQHISHLKAEKGMEMRKIGSQT